MRIADFPSVQDYAHGKQLTISVDETAARALYAAALGGAGTFSAFAPMPQMATHIASDPMACQIIWQKDGNPSLPQQKDLYQKGPLQQSGWYGHQNYSNQLSPHYQHFQQNQWSHDPHVRHNPQFQQYQLYQQYLRNQQYQYQQHERPLSSRRALQARAKRGNTQNLAQDEAEKEDGKAEAASQDGKAAKIKASPKKPRAPSDLIVVSARPGQPGDRAILECAPPEESGSEPSEDEAAVGRRPRKTLLNPVQLSNISQIMFDDDLFEDEEEEDKESDEVVVVEDKPSISHKQAQSAHLLASLQRMEKRGATAPAAHLSHPRPLPPASPPRRSRPKTTPVIGSKPRPQAQKGYRCYGSVPSRPTTVGSGPGSASGNLWTRPGTVESKAKSPVEAEQAAYARPDWEPASA